MSKIIGWCVRKPSGGRRDQKRKGQLVIARESRLGCQIRVRWRLEFGAETGRVRIEISHEAHAEQIVKDSEAGAYRRLARPAEEKLTHATVGLRRVCDRNPWREIFHRG